MITFDHHDLPNLAFAAMPKTGSSWTCRALQALGYSRVSDAIHGHELNRLSANNLAGYRTFTVLRDPADWLQSYYRYSRRDWDSLKMNPPGGPCGILAPFMELPWSQFLERVTQYHLLNPLYLAYSKSAEFHLKHENLESDLCHMLSLSQAQCGKVSNTPRENETRYNQALLQSSEYTARQVSDLIADNYISWGIWKAAQDRPLLRIKRGM